MDAGVSSVQIRYKNTHLLPTFLLFVQFHTCIHTTCRIYVFVPKVQKTVYGKLNK